MNSNQSDVEWMEKTYATKVEVKELAKQVGELVILVGKLFQAQLSTAMNDMQSKLKESNDKPSP